MSKEYSAKVVWSSRDLSVREKLAYKDVSSAVSLNDLTKDGPVTIEVELWLQVEIHNEKSKNEKDYSKYIIVDTAGTSYQSGSNSLHKSLSEISDDIEEARSYGEHIPFVVEVFRKPSANYKDKEFLTAKLAL